MKKIMIFCAAALILCVAGAYAQNAKADKIYDEIVKVEERNAQYEQNLKNMQKSTAKRTIDDLKALRELQKNIKHSKRELNELNKAYYKANLEYYFGIDYENNIFYLVDINDIKAIEKKIKKNPSILEEKYEDRSYFLNNAIRWHDLELTKVVLKYSKTLKYGFERNPALDVIDNIVFKKKWTCADMHDVLFDGGLYELLYDKEGKELKSNTLWYFLFSYTDCSQIFDTLVSKTPDINYRSVNGYSFLNILHLDKSAMLKTLLDAGIEFDVYKYPKDMEMYMKILASDNMEIIELLKKYGKITKNIKLSHKDKTSYDNNIIHLAAIYDNVGIIDDILKTYANDSSSLSYFFNSKNESDSTPIEYAVLYNSPKVFKKLITFTPIKYNQKAGGKDKTYMELAEEATKRYHKRGTYILDYFIIQQKTQQRQKIENIMLRYLKPHMPEDTKNPSTSSSKSKRDASLRRIYEPHMTPLEKLFREADRLSR